MKIYNRKERLQISKKLKSGSGKGNLPKNKNEPNWRFIRKERQRQKEAELIEELDNRQQHKRVKYDDDNGQKLLLDGTSTSKLGNQKTWYSLSVALPGSILNNVQTKELKTYVAGQLARTFAIFCVDEIVIFDENSTMAQSQVDAYYAGRWTGRDPVTEKNTECNFLMTRIFEYLECPQYLRKTIFPIHPSLQFAGLLNPLDAMHHLRFHDLALPYREGVILERPAKNGQRCDIGLDRELILTDAEKLDAATRVSVKIDDVNAEGSKRLRGTLTNPQKIREEAGIYWGYSVRIAKGLSEVVSNSYDFVIGTSERGKPLADLQIGRSDKCKILIVFGGLKGLEAALQADESIEERDPAQFFPNYVNCLPDQGSRVIRTEEAIPICLTALKCKLDE